MSRAAAYFDVDGTLVDRHIVHQFVHIRTRMLNPVFRPAWLAWLLLRVPYYALLDQMSRAHMNAVFYRNYAGLPAHTVHGSAADCFRQVIAPHLFADGVACVRKHQADGRSVVLVTGSLRFIMEPLAEMLAVDELICPDMMVRDGRLTGELDGPVMAGDQKAVRVRDHAHRNGIDLAASYAYGDSTADGPMLRAVGHGHCVNPGKRLAAMAASHGWHVHRWRVGAANAKTAGANAAANAPFAVASHGSQTSSRESVS